MTTNFLSPADLSKRWNVTEHTLGQWRWNARGPQYLKVGRRILYRLSEVEAFEEQRLRRHTSQR